MSSNPRGVGDAAPYGWLRDARSAEPWAGAERALSGDVRDCVGSSHAPPAPVRCCAAASQDRALHAGSANPAPRAHVPALLSAREAKARFWRLKRIPHRDTQRTSKQLPNSPQALCAPSHAAGGFPFGGPGTLSLAKHQRKRPRRSQIVGQNKKKQKRPRFLPGALLWIWEFGRGKSI